MFDLKNGRVALAGPQLERVLAEKVDELLFKLLAEPKGKRQFDLVAQQAELLFRLVHLVRVNGERREGEKFEILRAEVEAKLLDEPVQFGPAFCEDTENPARQLALVIDRDNSAPLASEAKSLMP